MFAYSTKLGFESDSFFRTIRDGVEHYVPVHELSEYQQVLPRHSILLAVPAVTVCTVRPGWRP